MSESGKSFLNFVFLNELDYWDVKRYTNDGLLSFNNAALLRNILVYDKESISKDLMRQNQWQIISKINFSGKLFLRDYNEIDTYKGSLYKVPSNSIIYSKINVRHGCVYYHEKDKTPFAVSSEYPIFLFDDKKINGYYLKLILRSDSFKKLLNTKTSGISKARVKVDEFLNIKIPLPSLKEQNELLEKYNTKIALAQQQEQEAKEIEQSIEAYLFKELGIEKIEEKQKSSKLQFVESKDIDRWDIWTLNNKYVTNKYTINLLKNVIIGKPQYGANEKGIKKITDTRYIRITDINEDGHLNNNIVSPENIDEKFILNENDFLIARSGNTVGKTFLYKNIYGRAIYAGYLVKYTLNMEKIIPDYLLYFTKSLYYKNWIQSNQRVSGQPNINGQEFLYSPIILPPLNIQEKIATEITKRKEKIKLLKQQALKNKDDAIREFEEEIFHNEDN